MKLLSKQYRVVAVACLVYTALFNIPFFSRFYAANLQGIPLSLSAIAFLWGVHFLFFSLLAGRYTTRLTLALGFLAAAGSSYFSSVYGVVTDTEMLKNVLATDVAEAGGLFNWTLALAIVLGGILPAVFILRMKIPLRPLRQELLAKAIAVAVSAATVLVAVWAFSADYTSFFREHKSVRYFATPITPLYSLLKLTADTLSERFAEPLVLARTTFDDRKVASLEDGHELVIMIVGETVRADHIGLNGYQRQTTPRLAAMDHLVSFANFTSCGTATAVSVPCMFSPFSRKKFSDDAIYSSENVLDVLERQGVAVLWRDNNSSSKGVADRVDYQSFRSSDVNPQCNPECRDEGMLAGLDDYIAAHPGQDIFILLHAMGSHGPEYYKRYPAEYGRFQPTCQTNHLSQCSEEELRNSYDNTILYADSFIADSIELLKSHPDYETALLYVSDHGESLGENNIYLHGLPYDFAPSNQKQVAALAWLPPNSDFDFARTRAQADAPFSHDNLYCSLLSVFEVTAAACHEVQAILVLEEEAQAELDSLAEN